ncbi:MAG: transposase [Gammaproteobacteria bacterium]
MEFHVLGRRAVLGAFDGGKISSDSGRLLLREVEQRTGILSRLSGCFVDHRDPDHRTFVVTLLGAGYQAYRSRYYGHREE